MYWKVNLGHGSSFTSQAHKHIKTNFCIKKQIMFTGVRVRWPVLLVWEGGTSVLSSRKRKDADEQQDVNYTGAVKSTLHVGLNLSTVNREECQTTMLESAEQQGVWMYTLCNCNWKHLFMHKCAAQTNSHIHTQTTCLTAIMTSAIFCFDVTCLCHRRELTGIVTHAGMCFHLLEIRQNSKKVSRELIKSYNMFILYWSLCKKRHNNI